MIFSIFIVSCWCFVNPIPFCFLRDPLDLLLRPEFSFHYLQPHIFEILKHSCALWYLYCSANLVFFTHSCEQHPLQWICEEICQHVVCPSFWIDVKLRSVHFSNHVNVIYCHIVCLNRTLNPLTFLKSETIRVIRTLLLCSA